MVEQLFADYDKLGGSLDQETYDGLRGSVDEMETNPIPDRAFIDPCTGVMITSEVHWVYSQISKGALRRFFGGDQQIMAETMLVVMGDSQERGAYMRGYSPQVNFRINLMQGLAPEPDQGVRQTFRPTEPTKTVVFARG
jgi:hypothetical protein